MLAWPRLWRRRRRRRPPRRRSPAAPRAPVTLNFVNADIEAVTRAIAAMIERQIAVDPRVKGTITVYSEQPLTPARGLPELPVGAARPGLHDRGKQRPAEGRARGRGQAADRHRVGGRGGARGDQVITQIFRLNHENPNNLVAVLRPLISPNNTINATPGTTRWSSPTTPTTCSRLAKIIAALDQPAATEIEVVPLQHAHGGRHGPAGAAPGRRRRRRHPGAGRRRRRRHVDARRAAQQLADRARAQPGAPGDGAPLIDKLDRPSATAQPAGNIWVVYLKNADAVKLATVLRAAFQRQRRRRRRRRNDGQPTPTQHTPTARAQAKPLATARPAARRSRRSDHAGGRRRPARRPAASSRPTRRPTR